MMVTVKKSRSKQNTNPDSKRKCPVIFNTAKKEENIVATTYTERTIIDTNLRDGDSWDCAGAETKDGGEPSSNVLVACWEAK